MNGIMILTLVFAAGVCALAGLIIERKNREERVTISFKEAMNLVELPIITFTNNNVKLNFILDTGSNISHINSTVLDKLDYKVGKTKYNTTGFTGDSQKSTTCVMSLYHNGIEFKNTFAVSNLDAAFGAVKQQSGVTVHGILGSIFFAKYKYILDFDKLKAYPKNF